MVSEGSSLNALNPDLLTAIIQINYNGNQTSKYSY
jgi:hypothetical protein